MKKGEGWVTSTLLKPKRGEPMVRPQNGFLSLSIELGGVENDANADPSSPRQVLLVSDETLSRLGLEPEALRANIVVSGLDVDALESGTVLQLGNQAQIRVTFGCEVCKKVPSSIRQSIAGKRGVLGVVAESGRVAVGDRVFNRGKEYPAIPTSIYERFLWLVRRIPEGKVVSYGRMTTLLGVARTYCRVIPRYVERAAPSYPIHRIVDSFGRIDLKVTDQRARLENEGVAFIGGRVDLGTYMWSGQGMYLR